VKPSSSELRVWGVGTPRTMHPHWVLAELGLDYETREVLPRSPAMQSPDFLRVSRRNKVPILECGWIGRISPGFARRESIGSVGLACSGSRGSGAGRGSGDP
jgi:hypothetical protein